MSKPAKSLQEHVHEIAGSSGAMRTFGATRATIRRLLWPYFRVEIVNREGLDVDGAVIFAPVHRSNLDAPLIAAGAERRCRVLAKQSLFSFGPARWFISCLGAFPVERGTADRESLRVAVSLLKAGDPLLVFPEGTRQSGPEVAEVFDGVGYLAAKSGAPVVPIAIAGTEDAMAPGTRFPRREKVVIVVGDQLHAPVNASGRLTVSARVGFSVELRARLQELLDEAHRQRGITDR